MSTYERVVSPAEESLGLPLMHAQALPFGSAQHRAPGALVEVALLGAPSAGEPFVLRAPRGALVPGVLFGLRFLELGRMRLCLARALELSEPDGAAFDLVGAQLVRSIADDPRAPEGGDPRLTEVAGIRTLRGETSIRLLTLVVPGEKLRLLAAPGTLSPGVFFGLRYFDANGPRRGLVRVDRVRPRSVLLDEIEGALMGTPRNAPGRESYRAPFDLLFTAELIQAEARPVIGRLTDLSADGVGIQVNATLEPGERIRVHDPSLPGLHGAELAIVRRDRHEGKRHGARFVEPNRGLSVLAMLLGLDRDRPARRELGIGDVGRSREAIATPLTVSDATDVLRQTIG